jgi:hypothetical protein
LYREVSKGIIKHSDKDISVAVYLTGRTGFVCLQENRGLCHAVVWDRVRIIARQLLRALHPHPELQPHKVAATEGASAVASLQFV